MSGNTIELPAGVNAGTVKELAEFLSQGGTVVGIARPSGPLETFKGDAIYLMAGTAPGWTNGGNPNCQTLKAGRAGGPVYAGCGRHDSPIADLTASFYLQSETVNPSKVQPKPAK